MEFLKIIIIAVALAMDAFTVSICGGANSKKTNFKTALLVGSYFGIFQSLMFLLGFLGGLNLKEHIDAYDHWIALGLLLFIGGEMIVKSLKKTEEKPFTFKHKVLIVLALATSIDALGVGLGYSLLNSECWGASIIIGIVAFTFSIVGMHLGKILKEILKNKAELLGGIILIGIGINIAIEHGAFSF